MANFVVKSNNNKELFSIDKVEKSVEKAAKDAGLPEQDIMRIINEVSSEVIRTTANLTEVSTGSIKARVLSHLDVVAPEVSKAWRDYDKKNKAKKIL